MPTLAQLRLTAPLGEPSRVVFASPLVEVGLFRCHPSHPKFGDSGPTKRYCFVFPRVAVWIEHAGRRPFVADSSVVPLYNIGHPYKRRRIGSEGDRTDWFSVAPAILREMLASHGLSTAEADRQLFQSDFARVDSRTFLAQRRIVQHVRRGESVDALLVEESVIGVLDKVLSNESGAAPQSSAKPQHRELVDGARAYLNLTLAKSEGLSALARAVQSSVFHLCRVFREQSGLTITRYRNQLRLRKALELLGEGEEDILTTALALGYWGHSHFTSAFHQAFGITPSEFRRMSRRHRMGVTTRFRMVTGRQ